MEPRIGAGDGGGSKRAHPGVTRPRRGLARRGEKGQGERGSCPEGAGREGLQPEMGWCLGDAARRGGVEAGPRKGPWAEHVHIPPQEGAREAGLRPALQMKRFIYTASVQSSPGLQGEADCRGPQGRPEVGRGAGRAR